MNNSKQLPEKVDFNAISLKLASPERIRAWSYGEVTKAETINYRTGRSERGGLFDERIFGPEKDYECYCGKYRRIRYKDIICERCGVEVTRSIVRRERMGHIDLATPVAHIWFLRGVPSRIGLLLNLSIADLEKVVYFAGYIITKVNENERERLLKEIDAEFKSKVKTLQDERSKEKLRELASASKRALEAIAPWQVIDEVNYHRLSLKYGSVFEAEIGAEAIYNIFRDLDLKALQKEVEGKLATARPAETVKIHKRLQLVKSMSKSEIRPEWMFLTVLPVIPPDLRPMVSLEGGRHATSDANDLYRRVINRNNRLKKLLELNAPDVILRNEKRILQEAVDALIDNSIRRSTSSGAMSQAQRRPLKSLSDNLKGKQGRFRQNLLGKRVDYSGRSVIVVGPHLRLDECGLPKLMALELFRPFVISQILAQELAFNIRGAGRLIDDQVPEVWEILEQVIKDKYVLLNRAPTLHRLGIQAFRPMLIEGSAIQVHPLVCNAFNADFDGDQMAVHLPLSAAAQRESRELMAADKNILKPGSGGPIVNPKLDIVLGIYWVTKLLPTGRGAGGLFASTSEALAAFDFGALDLRAPIKLARDAEPKFKDFSETVVETSVGRILFNRLLPESLPFVNREISGRDLTKLTDDMIVAFGPEAVHERLDRLKDFGFKYATRSGVTWGLDEVMVPEAKGEVVTGARREAAEIEKHYQDGLLSREERYRLLIETWSATKTKIEKLLPQTFHQGSSVADMLNSGARGSYAQLGQMSGMKGLVVSLSGRQIEFPIIPSYKEGLSPIEYFITTHGSRKTLTDTALNTAKAGYLTQRLVNVAQEVVVTIDDCGDTAGRTITKAHTSPLDPSIASLIRGRVLTKDVKDKDGKTMFKKGHLLSRDEAGRVAEAGVEAVAIRTLLTCAAPQGVCATCYGYDLGRGSRVKIGEAVGIVAAQAIGEPGTQLTMRTKHSGGVDVGGDIVGGLPRVEEIFERRAPKYPAIVSESDGVISSVVMGDKEIIVKALAEGRAGSKSGAEVEYAVPSFRNILVKEGDEVKRGQVLSDGPVNLQELFKHAGKEAVEEYIIRAINTIYELQSASISRKHLELIIRQMFSRCLVKDGGDTSLEAGEVVERVELLEVNKEAKERGGKEATAETLLLGILEVALSTSSFLAAVSFQQATKVLIRTAVKGGLDKLRGLKENVIIGRLIPAGTGLDPDYDPENAAREAIAASARLNRPETRREE